MVRWTAWKSFIGTADLNLNLHVLGAALLFGVADLGLLVAAYGPRALHSVR
jgi:hypothetical protein